MKIIKIAAPVPIDMMPDRNTPYVYHRRLTDTQSQTPSGGRTNKEYIVRVYRFDTPPASLAHIGSQPVYVVIAFYGRIGGTLQNDYVTYAHSRNMAFQSANNRIRLKENAPGKHYVLTNNRSTRGTNVLPGVDETQVVVTNTPTPLNPPTTQPQPFPPVSQPNQSSIDLPTIEVFESELRFTNRSRMGAHTYQVEATGIIYLAKEYAYNLLNPIRTLSFSLTGRELAIRQCVQWATERRNQQGGNARVPEAQPSPSPEQEKPFAMPKREELSQDTIDLLDLFAKNKTWYKAAQRRERRENEIPSIRLPTDKIPRGTDTEYISNRIVYNDFGSVFIIRVYHYEDDRYSTIEWYTSTNRVGFNPHPKILTDNRREAEQMAERLFNNKLLEGWGNATNRAQGISLPDFSSCPGRPASNTPAQPNQPAQNDILTASDFATTNEEGKYGKAIGNFKYEIAAVGDSLTAGMIFRATESVVMGSFLGIQNSAVFPYSTQGREQAVNQCIRWNIERQNDIRRGEEREEEQTPPSQSPSTPEQPKSFAMPKREELSQDTIDLLDLFAKNNSMHKHSIAVNNEDWYLDAAENVGKDLKGYFKFIVEVEGITSVYNIWWKGLDTNVSIIKHDLSDHDFEQYKDTIMRQAKEESIKSFKEVMSSYGEE